MRRAFATNVLLAAMLCLHSMMTPPDRHDILPAIGAATLILLPCLSCGLILPRSSQIIWACLGMCCSAASLYLPLIAILMPASGQAMFFGLSYWSLSRVAAGWLLRSCGASTEKNFALIPAYRQTLRHIGSFPGEADPAGAPLFQPARNAMSALIGLIPIAGWMLGLIANSVCFALSPMKIAAFPLRALAVCVLLTCLPDMRTSALLKRFPDRTTMLLIGMRSAILPLIAALCLRGPVRSAALLMLIAPPHFALQKDLAAPENLQAIRKTHRLMLTAWLVLLPVFILLQ